MRKVSLLVLTFSLLTYFLSQSETRNVVLSHEHDHNHQISILQDDIEKKTHSITNLNSVKELTHSKPFNLSTTQKAFFKELAEIKNYKDPHGFPEEHKKAAQILGEISDLVGLGKLKSEAALGFYMECLEKSYVPTSIRAVCLRSGIKIVTELGLELPSIVLNTPKHIFEIANRI